MIQRIQFATFIFVTFLMAIAQASTVFITKPTGEGVEENIRTTIEQLSRAAVSSEVGAQLAADAKSADYVLSPKVMKLGNAYVVSIDKMKAGNIVFTSTMKAMTAEELDTVTARVVRAVMAEQKATEAATVSDVTKEEETGTNRKIKSTRQWKIAFGPAWGQNMNTSESSSYIDIGYFWGIDAKYDVYINMKTSGFSNSAIFTDYILGMSYHFAPEKNSTYFRGGFGRALGQSGGGGLFSNDTFSGWGFETAVGYRMFRTSDVNIAIEGFYSWSTSATSTSQKIPALFGAGLAIFY